MSTSLVGQDLETRHHELRKTRMVMVDGNLTVNLRTVQRGLSARAYRGGYWGFASAPLAAGAASASSVQQQAFDNARAMARFGARPALALPEACYVGRHAYRGRAPLTAGRVRQRLAAVAGALQAALPGPALDALRARRGAARQAAAHRQRRRLAGQHPAGGVHVHARSARMPTARRSRSTNTSRARATWPTWTGRSTSWRRCSTAAHEHLQAKRHAVPARGGLHTVVLAPRWPACWRTRRWATPARPTR